MLYENFGINLFRLMLKSRL